MPKENIPEKISNEIPEELIKLIESEDTAFEIARICFENGIKEEEKIKEIGYQTGRVLLGDLPPEKFSKILSERTKLPSFLASEIAREINKSIFDLVKEALAILYKTEIKPSEKPAVGVPEVRPSPEKPLEERPKKADIYREPIE